MPLHHFYMNSILKLIFSVVSCHCRSRKLLISNNFIASELLTSSMAVSKSEDSTPLKPEPRSSIRACYKHINLYQYPFCVCIFLFMLYRIFPSLFFFILRSSPVFAITSILLAALLTYGEKETKSLESCSRDNNSQINTALITCDTRETNILESCSKNNYSETNTDIKCCQSPALSESEENSESQHEEKRNHEKERFLRLSSLIERRRARMSIRHEIKRNLIAPDGETLVEDESDFGDRVSPVTIPSWDPFSDQSAAFGQVPGSAPSILHHRKSPFEKLLPGTASFSRLDPYFVTEVDLVEKRDATASLMSDHSNNRRMLGVELQDDQKKLNLKNKSTIHGEGNISAVLGNLNKPEFGRDNSGHGLINADNSQLESKEALIRTEIEKDMVIGQENGTSSYCDTIMLSEYLNLCSSGLLPPRKKHTLSGRFPMVKLDECEIESNEEEVKNPSDGTGNGVCIAGVHDQEIVKFDLNGEHEENLEVKEKKVNDAHDGSCNLVSDRRELVLETVKIEENGEDKSLEYEEDGNSVKEVKSILKQDHEELVKAEPNLGVVPKPDHEKHKLVSDETGMKLLSEPKAVKEGKNEGEENGSVTCESDVAPDGLLRRFSRLDSITSNLKILRKQNKHGESSSSSSDDSD